MEEDGMLALCHVASNLIKMRIKDLPTMVF